MIKFIYTFLLLYFSLLHFSENQIKNLKNLKPSPEKIPVTFEAHGVKRVDNYYWMRDDSRKDRKILNHLNSENDYLEDWFLSGKDIRSKLFDEITSRIPKKEDSVPVRLKNYEYFRRYKPGNEHAIYIRRRDKNSREFVLLDVNELAKGEDFYQLANWSISPQENLLAFAEDLNGRRQYKIKFKDLDTDSTYDYSIENTSGDMAWSKDGRFLFYVLRDEETLLPYKVKRHEIGTSFEKDTIVYEENDSTFHLSVGNTRSMEFIELNSSSTTSSEVRLIYSDDPKMEPLIFLEREDDHLYSVDHDPASNRFIVESNWNAINFRLLEANLENSNNKKLWKELIPHRKDVLLQSVIPFPQHLVIMERENGLKNLKILDKKSQSIKNINFNDPTYTAYLAANPEYDTDRFYFGYSSMRTPDSLFSVGLSSGRKRLLKEAEVKGQFSSSDYKVDRKFIEARDGTLVPVSLVYKRTKFKKNKNPLFVYGYGSYGLSVDAGFSSTRLSLLDRGFVFAIAHIRGGQEMGRRAGTENIVGIAGFGAAAEASAKDLADCKWKKIEELRDFLEKTLEASGKPIICIGRDASRLPNTTCFAAPGWKGETQVMQMDLAGFAVSAGSACSSGKVNSSRVLEAMGFEKNVANSAIRVSLGPLTMESEIVQFATAWLTAYDKFLTRRALI